jgi:hypothetical protein
MAPTYTPTARESEAIALAKRLHINGTFRSRGLNVKSPDAPAASQENWIKLHTQLLADSASKDFNTILKDMIYSDKYVASAAVFDSLVSALKTSFGKTTARILVCLPDGTVFYDSSRIGNTDSTKTNTWTNADKKTINENHNTRAAVINAQLAADGVSFESRFSTSTDNFEDYVAVRIGPQGASAGTVRYSV